MRRERGEVNPNHVDVISFLDGGSRSLIGPTSTSIAPCLGRASRHARRVLTEGMMTRDSQKHTGS